MFLVPSESENSLSSVKSILKPGKKLINNTPISKAIPIADNPKEE
jgi:hypothetical protein